MPLHQLKAVLINNWTCMLLFCLLDVSHCGVMITLFCAIRITAAAARPVFMADDCAIIVYLEISIMEAQTWNVILPINKPKAISHVSSFRLAHAWALTLRLHACSKTVHA